MKYAVIKTGGKQYKVSEGQTIAVEKIEQPSSSQNKQEDNLINFNEVLLLVEDEKVTVGKPTIDANVQAKILDQFKDKKVNVLKYKPKTGYHRSVGHRQLKTKILIESIKGK